MHSEGFFVLLLPESSWLLILFVCLGVLFLQWKYFASRYILVLFSTSSLPFCCYHVSLGSGSCRRCNLLIVLVYLEGVFFLLTQDYVAHSAQCKLLRSFPGASQRRNAEMALEPLGRLHSVPEKAPAAIRWVPSPGGD